MSKDIRKRYRKDDKRLNKERKALEKEITLLYKDTFHRIDQELGALYRKTSTDLTMTEIQKINQYEPLMAQLHREIKRLSGEQLMYLDGSLSVIYQNTYVYSIEAIEDTIGKRLGIPSISPDIIEASVKNPISGLTLSERMEGHRVEITNRIKANLTQGLIIGEPYGKLSQRLQDDLQFSATKANRVVRTESHRVISEARQKSYEDSVNRGLDMKKEWLATSDERTRNTHKKLDGKVIGVDEKFEIRGYESDRPGGFGVAKEDINCRCRVIPYFDEE